MASQLSLLQRNADKHGDNPDFQKDMKLTVKNTVEKMNDLLSRINIVNEPSKTREFAVIDVKPVVMASVETFKTAGHNVAFKGQEDIYCALSNHDDLETVLMHIIQNALDASEDQKLVEISLAQDKNYVMIKVADSGTGMDKDFIRNELFRPFRSLKEGGYGIGAYESRQLIQNMSGRMEVKSKPGAGTLVTIYLKKE